MKGCSCGRRLFLYVREEDKNNSRKFIQKLGVKKSVELEKQALEIATPSVEEVEEPCPLVINFESIKGYEAGRFSLDLDRISKGKPLVFEVEEGKYLIDLGSFSSNKKESSKGKKSKIMKSKKGLMHVSEMFSKE